MPELPEVETVKKTLEKEILGAILLKPTIYYSPLIKTDLAEYQKEIVGTNIYRYLSLLKIVIKD